MPWAEICTCVPTGSAAGRRRGEGQTRARRPRRRARCAAVVLAAAWSGNGASGYSSPGALPQRYRGHPGRRQPPRVLRVSPRGGPRAGRCVLLGPREPAEQLHQLLHLGGGEALGEDRRQRLQVRLGGVQQQRPARVGDGRVGHAGVAGAVLLAHESRALEPVEQARHPGRREARRRRPGRRDACVRPRRRRGRRSASKSVTVIPLDACRSALNERVMAAWAPIRRTQAVTAALTCGLNT